MGAIASMLSFAVRACSLNSQSQFPGQVDLRGSLCCSWTVLMFVGRRSRLPGHDIDRAVDPVPYG